MVPPWLVFRVQISVDLTLVSNLGQNDGQACRKEKDKVRLDLSDDQQFFQETVRRFVETETPIVVVRELYEHADGFDASWWRSAAELGWTSFLIPEANGGGSVSGETVVDLAIVAEEMGRVLAPGPLLSTNVVAVTIGRCGTDAQQELLAGVLAGETVLAWAFCEVGGDWTGTTVGLEAVASDDGFVLNGAKVAVEAAGVAHHILVTARVNGQLTQFLVDADTPGVDIVAVDSLDLGKRFAMVEFADVAVGSDAVIGEVGGAAGDVERQRLVAIALQTAETCGAMARVFEFTVEYAFDRHSFGRPLASYQELKHRFADMKMWLEASHAICDAAADSLSGDEDATGIVEAAAAYVGEHSVELMQDCVQIHGGIGVTWEHDIHLYLRRATANRALYGTPYGSRQRLAAAAGL
jgi:alkylation response protein AidB-like acyl-CoA dehydrogenase